MREETTEKNETKVALHYRGALGDILVATETLFQAQKIFLNGQFTIIGNHLWKEILFPDNWPQIVSILEVEPKTLRPISLWGRNQLKPSEWSLAKSEHVPKNILSYLKQFAVTVDLKYESTRFAFKAFWTRVPVRIGASKNPWAKLLFTHFTLLKNLRSAHERDRLLSVLDSCFSENEKLDIKSVPRLGLPSLKIIENKDNPPFILINPTASTREKAWPSHKFRSFAFKLKKEKPDLQIKIIGSPSETAWLQEVCGKDFTLCQPKSISELLDITAHAQLLITNTSSLQFVAATTKTPTLTLMGLAKPERWGPPGKNDFYIKNKDFKPERKSFFQQKKEYNKKTEAEAYNSIEVDDVTENVLSFLRLK